MTHPVISVLLLAVVVRVFIVVVLTNYFSGTLVLDDTTYHFLARQMAEGSTAWDDFSYQLYWSTATFMVPVTFLYEIFGPSPIIGQFFVVAMGTLAAVLVTRLALEFLEPRWAFVAGSIVALLPSQAFWSSMLMKDASVWFVLAGLGATVAVASRATGRYLALLGVTAGSFLFLLSYLRLHTLVVATWALMIAACFGIKQGRISRIAGAVVLGITIPWVFGAIGPAGFSLITDHGSLEERRFFNAQGANTAIIQVVPQVPTVELESEAVELEKEATDLESQSTDLESQASRVETSNPAQARRLRKQAAAARDRAHTARVRAEAARDAAAANAPVPPGIGDAAPLNPNIAHLPRGLSVMLLEPLPIPFEGSLSLKFARLESLLWYPLLVLAAIGLWNVRPYLRQMVFPLLVGGGVALMYALSEGNVGTAHRHRGEFVWVVALLAIIGLRKFVHRRLARN